MSLIDEPGKMTSPSLFFMFVFSKIILGIGIGILISDYLLPGVGIWILIAGIILSVIPLIKSSAGK